MQHNIIKGSYNFWYTQFMVGDVNFVCTVADNIKIVAGVNNILSCQICIYISKYMAADQNKNEMRHGYADMIKVMHLMILISMRWYYRQTSSISCTLIGNKIVEHSDVTSSSFLILFLMIIWW